ncbi:MAG: hypothetical protein U1D41_05760 [Nitrosomonas sp.]|uniref:hypothetical protein n=1 Tax=Nitrosomonas sp. TaxID=42353 RepID=UPI002736EFB3|nr:hypothetical protein [Nitrosomonas sp.]MDP3279953.1 hypothetical protein [Nitrosomonas sp.]MDP3663840.1 hypothetical protein [Nitrosomonas sp.]MDZ4105658.1 hypothetical protein [Nitrosomonas sp.]
MKNFYDSQEAKNKELLTVEKPRLTEKREQISNAVLASTEHAASKTAALTAIEDEFIHGKATAEDVETARLAADSANAKLQSDQRLLALADSALKEIDQKIESAQRDYELARRMQLQKIAGELSVNLNTNTRDKLLEIMAAEGLTGIEYGSNWQQFLARVFPAPDLNTIVAAQDAFCHKHKFER